MKKRSLVLNFILIVILIFFAGLLGSVDFSSEKRFSNGDVITIKKPTLVVGSTEVFLDVARSGSDRARGLSGRESLSVNEGMLFVFRFPDTHGFWMKDMNFPIDIAWMDKNLQIVHIEHQVKPESYPETFYPDESAVYVIELVSGFFEDREIEVGDVLDIQNI